MMILSLIAIVSAGLLCMGLVTFLCMILAAEMNLWVGVPIWILGSIMIITAFAVKFLEILEEGAL